MGGAPTGVIAHSCIGEATRMRQAERRRRWAREMLPVEFALGFAQVKAALPLSQPLDNVRRGLGDSRSLAPYLFAQTITAFAPPSQLAPFVPSICKAPVPPAQ